jgi:hypothetical protein
VTLPHWTCPTRRCKTSLVAEPEIAPRQCAKVPEAEPQNGVGVNANMQMSAEQK